MSTLKLIFRDPRLILVSIFSYGMFAIAFLPTSRAEVMKVKLGTLGPACAICNGFIEGKLQHVSGIEKVLTNIKDSTFFLVLKSGQPLDVVGVKQAVKDSGYDFRYIRLTIQGMLTDTGGKPAFKEPQSGQVFQLVQGERAPLSPERLQEMKTLSNNGEKPIIVEGTTYPIQGENFLEPTKISVASQ